MMKNMMKNMKKNFLFTAIYVILYSKIFLLQGTGHLLQGNGFKDGV